MNRRGFLAGAGVVAAASSLPTTVFAASSASQGLSILQGLTTATTTQLSVDVEKDKKVAYTLIDVATKRAIAPLSVKPVTFGSSSTLR